MVSIANSIRALGMDAVLKAKSGHVGLPLGGAEMITALYFHVMHTSAANPQYFNRDRFVLSAGHGSMLQYAALHLAGFAVSMDDLKSFRQLNSLTPGHPEYAHTAGVECTTGPLGQGIAMAVGMAMAERKLREMFEGLVDHNTYVILGDGCMMEGVSHEACSLAGHLKLNRLMALYDCNNITIDGTIDIAFSEDVAKRFEAYGWHVVEAPAHSVEALVKVLKPHASKPTLFICKSTAGKGSPKWEGKPKIHGNPMTAEDVYDAKVHLGFSPSEAQQTFWVPEAVRAEASTLARQRDNSAAWEAKVQKQLSQWRTQSDPRADQWEHMIHNTIQIPLDFESEAEGKSAATRASSGKALQRLAALNPQVMGGSADLAGSNNTTLPDGFWNSAEFGTKRNIHFGVREHGMAALCNGMALHGGVLPYCATFAVFSDYLRPALRLSALMKVRVVYIFTHDSYAVGEDGPTHQPVEHVASLREIPNLQVLRPADDVETYAAWQKALQYKGPTALMLTRQDVPHLGKRSTCRGMDEGGYILKECTPHRPSHVTLLASGSEVSLALQAAHWLESLCPRSLDGVAHPLGVRVVSCPAPQNLRKNPHTLHKFAPESHLLVALEAGTPSCWGEIVGRRGMILGLNRFGASGPLADLTKHFGFTPEAVGRAVLNKLKLREGPSQ